MTMNPKVQLPMDLSVFGELDLDAAAASLAAREKQMEKEIVAGASKTPLPASVSPATIDQDLVHDSMDVIEEEYRPITPNPPIVPVSQMTGNEAQDKLPNNLPNGEASGGQSVSVIPLAVLPTKKKKSQRAKFRAKPRPKSNKAKARVAKR